MGKTNKAPLQDFFTISKSRVIWILRPANLFQNFSFNGLASVYLKAKLWSLSFVLKTIVGPSGRLENSEINPVITPLSVLLIWSSGLGDENLGGLSLIRLCSLCEIIISISFIYISSSALFYKRSITLVEHRED